MKAEREQRIKIPRKYLDQTTCLRLSREDAKLQTCECLIEN